jgi:hypothetical protein
VNEKAVWTPPAVAFRPDAVLVTFLATAVVKLLLPVPLATRAAVSAAGLALLRNNMVAATAAVGSTLDDTEEESTAKREETKFVIGLEYTHLLS